MIKKVCFLILLLLLIAPTAALAGLKTCPGISFSVPEDIPCPDPNSINCMAGSNCNIAANAGTIDFNPGNGFGTNAKDFLTNLIGRVTKYLLYVVLVVAPLLVIIGGAMILTAADQPKRVENGKKMIIWSLVGLGIFLLAKTIGNVITTAFWPD